jgi:hypothetical protein
MLHVNGWVLTPMASVLYTVGERPRDKRRRENKREERREEE